MPVAPNHVQLPDERRICARCHQTAVYDPAHAQKLCDYAARIAADQLGLGLNVGVDFTLVDNMHLQRLVTEMALDPDDDRGQGKVVGLYLHKGRKRVMYVLLGLPQILLVQTVAHEWAHAWQGENCPLLQDPLVREGFAEWAAYKTLQTMGAVDKMALMEQQNGLYGKGLQQMLELERRGGVSGVLAFCRRAE